MQTLRDDKTMRGITPRHQLRVLLPLAVSVPLLQELPEAAIFMGKSHVQQTIVYVSKTAFCRRSVHVRVHDILPFNMHSVM